MVSQLTHVLLVDDEPAICKALALALSRAGFRVTTALSGETAMSVVRGEHVDLLVVDLRIPDMRGDTLFELAAAIQPHLRTRALFTTGDITERAQELIEACRCPLLRKPFDLKDLIEWVRGVQPVLKEQKGQSA
ncbi:MAG TPA: response regulator [Gemmatimonadaceae bacterium]|nr:response regulator [Gemmatimonadaceae bacterium]